jgi:hypothetical protein
MAALSTYDRWLETTQNKINHDIQTGDPKQFLQQCDYAAPLSATSRAAASGFSSSSATDEKRH